MSEKQVLEEMKQAMRTNGTEYIERKITWRVYCLRNASITRKALKKYQALQSVVNQVEKSGEKQ